MAATRLHKSGNPYCNPDYPEPSPARPYRILTNTPLNASLAPMKIYINGEAREVPEPFTAAQLVTLMGLEGRRIAMEANLDIVPRSSYANHVFQPGDKIEVVSAVGGG